MLGAHGGSHVGRELDSLQQDEKGGLPFRVEEPPFTLRSQVLSQSEVVAEVRRGMAVDPHTHPKSIPE